MQNKFTIIVLCFINLPIEKILKMKKIEPKEMSFEDSIKKLEEIVDKLASGEVDLEKSLEYYKKGMELKKLCEDKLKKAELQIKKIKIENNKVSKEDF